MIATDYDSSEVREGTKLIRHGEVLTVSHVVYRRGRGLELHTTHDDGFSGPIVYPHPDESVSVVYMPPLFDDDMAYLRITTSNYPWAALA